MNKLMKAALASVMGLSLVGCGSSSSTSSKTYIIATDKTYAPFEMTDKKGKLIVDKNRPSRYNTPVEAKCLALETSGSDALEGGKSVSEIYVKENESLDNALKRFKRSCAKSGVLADLRKKEYYQSPSVKRRKKSEAARKNKNKRYY